MRMIPVASTNISSIGYESSILNVRFHSGGLYAYYNVPTSVYNGLMSAPSKGKYLDAYVKGRYQYQRIG